MFYIYTLTNKSNNKIYIGQSQNPKARLRSHKSYARNGSSTKLHRAMIKYGFGSFQLNIIDSRESKDEINELERYYITEYNSIADGYNICEGGEGVTSEVAKSIVSQKRLDKISKMLKEKWKDPAYREAKIKQLHAMWTPEKIAEHSIICTASWNDERKAKNGEMSKRLWSDPEYRKKQSEAKKRHWQDPKYREKMCAMSKEKGFQKGNNHGK